MQTAYHPTPEQHAGKSIPVKWIAWTITFVLGWLGLPLLRGLLVWILMELYEMFVLHNL